MAVCRACYFAAVVVPASPRVPLKNSNKENATSNQDAAVPHKRALFDLGIENDATVIA